MRWLTLTHEAEAWDLGRGGSWISWISSPQSEHSSTVTGHFVVTNLISTAQDTWTQPRPNNTPPPPTFVFFHQFSCDYHDPRTLLSPSRPFHGTYGLLFLLGSSNFLPCLLVAGLYLMGCRLWYIYPAIASVFLIFHQGYTHFQAIVLCPFHTRI